MFSLLLGPHILNAPHMLRLVTVLRGRLRHELKRRRCDLPWKAVKYPLSTLLETNGGGERERVWNSESNVGFVSLKALWAMLLFGVWLLCTYKEHRSCRVDALEWLFYSIFLSHLSCLMRIVSSLTFFQTHSLWGLSRTFMSFVLLHLFFSGNYMFKNSSYWFFFLDDKLLVNLLRAIYRGHGCTHVQYWNWRLKWATNQGHKTLRCTPSSLPLKQN